MGEPVAPKKKPMVVDDEYKKEIEKGRRELRALILNNKCAPLMLRLAWQDAATYDKETGTGGPNGSIRTEQELNYRANKGLREAVQLCEDVKAKLKRVSYADLYQLAGVVAVEVTGGPHIDFLPGRKDSDKPSKDNLLPDPNLEAPSHLRTFAERVGLTDQDIVALCGAHTLGGAHRDRSGFHGKWTEDPLKFDNSYFKKLKEGEWLNLKEKELLKLKESVPLKDIKEELSQFKEEELSQFKEGELLKLKEGKLLKLKEGELLELNKGELLELKERKLLKLTEGELLELKERELLKLRERLLKLPTDKALLKDKKYHSHVDDYEKDEEKFFQEYADSHKKLTELGWDFKSGSEDNSSTSGKLNLPMRVIGIVIVSSTLIFGYLLKRKSIPRKTLESQN